MSQAVIREGQLYTGVLLQQGSICHLCEDESALTDSLLQSPDAIIFYNQSESSLSLIEQLTFKNQQDLIEIFQETRGVFGLRAYTQQGKILVPQTLKYFSD